MPSTETEVKFHVSHLVPLRDRLLAVGAVLHTPLTLEVNLRFDDARPVLELVRIETPARLR